MRAVLVALLVLAACGDDIKGNITVAVPDAWEPAISELVALTPYRGLSVGEGGDFRIVIKDDATIPAESYRLERPPGYCDLNCGPNFTVHAHDVLGAQYGTAAALEQLGFVWRHPFDPSVPSAPHVTGGDESLHQPAIRVRAMHFHTLHPIESYFAFWEATPGGQNDAHRIIDWVIKNRGNYVQWAGLDDIQDPANPDRHDQWQKFTRELIDYAHMRGVRVGIDIELFGNSNLQNAFDLRDQKNASAPLGDAINARLSAITTDLPFDVYDLSFGEFFNSDPQVFIDSTNEVAKQLRILAPQAEMHALVHVGATQRVTYMGRDMLYYFLVQYADPTIVPDIHSVMYFNLYDKTDGAYQHTDFSEHRQYLLDRICAGEKAAYHPETAYWVAFDNSIPTFLPLYVYSRWKDLDGLKRDGCGKPLDEHLIFSSGWEWGYWLNDYAALRSSFELPADPKDSIADAFGSDLAPAVDVVNELMAEQKRALIDDALTGYISSRDLAIDAGRMLNPPVISQPDRVTFDQLAGMTDVSGFVSDVMTPLKLHITNMDALTAKLAALDLPDSRWTRELRDGFELDRLRAHFIYETYDAVVAHVQGGDATAAFKRAQDYLAQAKNRVAARHADLHDTHGRRLVDRTSNHTFYQYGYLNNADTLCYWRRELDQAGAILGNTTEIPPGCLL